MADNLPEPKSRKESYLAKAAGMDVTIPEAPESRTEQYLAAIAEGGGGGGGTSDFDELTNRPKYNGTTMTSSTDIPASPTVVQTRGTSETDVMSQKAVTDVLFYNNSPQKIQIGAGADSSSTGNTSSIAIGTNSKATNVNAIAIGSTASSLGGDAICLGRDSSVSTSTLNSVAIGRLSSVTANHAVAVGSRATATQQGQFDISTGTSTWGYNNSNYRLLTGLYDGQSAHDAVTLGQLNTRLDNLTLLKISQTDYDNLQNKDANTLYVITGA